ncbi:MAG: DMT family transporter [Bacteroidia bacterium]
MGKYKNYVLLHFIVFIWGWTAILGKLITVSAFDLTWYRTLIAALAIFVFLKLKGISLHTTKQGLIRFFGVGAVVALHWIFFYEAVKINVSLGLVCFSSGTFFVSLLEPLFYKRRIVGYEVLIGLLVFSVIFLISDTTLPPQEGLHYLLQQYLSPNQAVVIFSLLGAFTSALFAVFNGMLVRTYDAKTITFYEMAGGFLFMSLYFVCTTHFSSAFFHISGMDILWLFILSIACTAFTFVASVSLMKELSPYTVVLSVNLEPIYGIILAWLIFDEKMGGRFYLEGLLIMALVFGNSLLKSRYGKPA